MNSTHIFHSWYSRVIAFILVIAFGYGIEILFAYTLNMFGISFLIMFFGMIGIEYARGGTYQTIGFPLDKNTMSDLFIGFMLGSIPIIMLIAGLNVCDLCDITLTNNVMISGIFSIVIYAIVEELLFRGMIFQACVERFSFIPTAIVFSLVFASAHVFNPSFDTLSMVNTLLAGLLFSYAWYHTRSLWLPIAIHIAWNLTLFVTGMTLSGIDSQQSIFSVNIMDVNLTPWLHSRYGIEGTVYCTLMLLLMGFVISKISVPPQRFARLFHLEYRIHHA
ncbi:MAG: CPBP family intramembrane glutamic endopeptidase [Candidatus Kapaibacteriota bacterium]|jgi:membrane protease YdiL (CAAX protease family)